MTPDRSTPEQTKSKTDQRFRGGAEYRGSVDYPHLERSQRDRGASKLQRITGNREISGFQFGTYIPLAEYVFTRIYV
jgi:hypothetical protein